MKARVFKMTAFGLAAIAGFGAIVMLLWNALVPGIFGLTAINFWQALGILALARILFGGFCGRRMIGHGGMRGGMHGNPIREKWMKMTDEERKAFIRHRREHMPENRFFGGGCGFDAGDDSEKKNE